MYFRKIRLLIIFILLNTFSLNINAQYVFNKTFGLYGSDDLGIGAFQLQDSSYILFVSQNLGSIHCLHISPLGSLLSDESTNLGSTQNIFSYKESDSLYYLTTFGFISKIDSDGTTLWTGNYHAYYALYIPLHNLNRLDINSLPETFKISLSRVDSGNNTLHTDTIILDSALDYLPSYAAELTDQSLIVAIKTDNDTISLGYTLLKCDTNGNKIWTLDLPIDTMLIFEVVALNDSGFIIGGITTNDTDNASNIFLMRFDKNGNILWNKDYPHHGAVYAFQFHILSDYGFIIGCEGSVSPGATGQDINLLRADSSGNLLWSRTFSTIYTNYFKSVYQTFDHGFIICGSTVAGNSYDYWLIKTDSLGITDSITTEITDPLLLYSGFNIFPNPAQNILYITQGNKELIKSISVFNSIGQEQLNISYLSIKNGEYIEVNTSSLSAGVYFLEMMTEREKVVRKFVRE